MRGRRHNGQAVLQPVLRVLAPYFALYDCARYGDSTGRVAEAANRWMGIVPDTPPSTVDHVTAARWHCCMPHKSLTIFIQIGAPALTRHHQWPIM